MQWGKFTYKLGKIFSKQCKHLFKKNFSITTAERETQKKLFPQELRHFCKRKFVNYICWGKTKKTCLEQLRQFYHFSVF